MKRRVFIVQAGKAVPAVVGAIYLVGCGDSSVAPATVAAISCVSTAVNAHSHTVRVPAPDQTKGATTTYAASSSLNHEHVVTLTASQMVTLGQQGTVTVTSTSSTVAGNHTHDFTFVGKKA